MIRKSVTAIATQVNAINSFNRERRKYRLAKNVVKPARSMPTKRFEPLASEAMTQDNAAKVRKTTESESERVR